MTEKLFKVVAADTFTDFFGVLGTLIFMRVALLQDFLELGRKKA